jgi:hypothetical protein
MVFVSTPQDLSALIVRKAIAMAEELHVSLAGLVENMATVSCPKCGHGFEPYGKSHAESMTAKHDVTLLGRLPIDPHLSELADLGKVGEYQSADIGPIVDHLLSGLVSSKRKTLKVL